MITKEVEELFKEHVREQYPKEACGFVVDGTFYPQENVAQNPEEEFKIAQYPGGNLQAILHSHPNVNKAVPSAADMRGQIQTVVPWGIVATDGKWVSPITWIGDRVQKSPLVGREFIHGVQDCYALVRDFYREEFKKILPEFPRDDEWWYDKEKADLLTPDNFKSAGFVEIEYDNLRYGDVILGAVLCERVNHCAIYVGQGLILHHLYNRKSRRETLGPWIRYCRYYLRFQG